MADAERIRRSNGLSPPFTTPQVSTWIFLPTLVVEFGLFVSPLLPLAASIPCTILFCVCAAASAYYGLQAMRTDPADPRLGASCHMGRMSHLHGPQDPNNPHHNAVCRPIWDPNEPTKQCWICDIQVGEKSMHCKFCNKCVDHFDHHCMWLNTCVGKANYRFFFRTMVAITAMLVIHSAIQIALILDIYLGNGNSKARSEEWLQANATIAIVIVMGVFLVFDIVALSLIGQLLLFHMRLQREGLSTYQFIIRENQRKREQNKIDQELGQKRTVAMAKAQEEGRSCDYLHLRIGGYMRKAFSVTCCDPLEEKRGHAKEQASEANGQHRGKNGHSRTRNGFGSYDQEEAKEPEDSSSE